MTEADDVYNEPTDSTQDGQEPTQSGGSDGAAPAEKPVVGDITDTEAEGAPAASTWPEDWRERWAAGDEKYLATLKRYASPENVAKAFGSLRAQLHAGELIKKLPENASDQEVAEWRAQMGLPEKPDGYQLTRVIGHEWSEADKPMINEFMEAAHASNFSQKQINTAMEWYGKRVMEMQEQQFEKDTLARQSLEDTLRTEWGPEFRGNIGLMKRYLDNDVPGGNGAALVNARLEDGSRLIDAPWFAKWMVDLARDVHGEAAFAGGEGISAGANRRAEIENIMHTDLPRYQKDKGMQAEYLALIQREERSRKRA